ncbi:MAG: c-type cytochrome biogenesis protein CcmI, partial [Emcibacter sp.]|nr:c-type cytochrome biogenesis protein CcmI [Emcibacter sp.]
MTIWILLTGLFLLALAMILVPLFRYRGEDSQPQNKNIAVYKAQLQELEADQSNGVLSAAEAASARLEIERRLLKIADNSNRKTKAQNSKTSSSLMVGAAVIILLLSVGFYLKIGMPAMPDFILKDQDHSIAKRAEKIVGSQDMVREVADIKAHLISSPDDIKAIRALGQYQSELRNKAEAAQAYQRWYELAPDNIDAAVVYAESLIMLSEGRVGPAAVLVLNRARSIQPQNPGARHYLALAQYQQGNISQALASW